MPEELTAISEKLYNLPYWSLSEMDTASVHSVYDVFKTQGQPTITYVTRQDGVYERKVSEAISNKGTICLLTGPSKTGKTTLYSKVAESLGYELVKVRCDKQLSPRDVWQKALEDVNFERISARQKSQKVSTEASGEIGGTIGWSWLAGLIGKLGLKGSKEWGEGETRDRILADAMPSHLVPVLKQLPTLLVVEDFHYLNIGAQEVLFQQWKIFVDNEVSVVVVGTTHHAVDLAYANKDLVGRLTHIDVGTWQKEDLERIAYQGFDYMKVEVGPATVKAIAAESVGLPIVTQAVCLHLLLKQNITTPLEATDKLGIAKPEAFDALHQVAREKFGSFEGLYDRLSRGLRKRRKYSTYELILSCFTISDSSFSFSKAEILDRLKRLPIKAETIPPPSLVLRTLSSLAKLQDRMGIELLEWSGRDQRLHILEPTFLFYLRWRKPRAQPPSLDDVLKEFTLFSDDIVVLSLKEAIASHWSKSIKVGSGTRLKALAKKPPA